MPEQWMTKMDDESTWEDVAERRARLKREWARKRQKALTRLAQQFGIAFAFRDPNPDYGPTVARCRLIGQEWPAVDWYLTTGTAYEVIPRTTTERRNGYVADVAGIGEMLRELAQRPARV
jgi:hypothetical protein